jgi:hypothetical protein
MMMMMMPYFEKNIHTIKKRITEVLLDASKKADLGKNVQRTRRMFMSDHQNAGQSHNLMTANKSFEKVAKFICMGTTVTIKNCIHEEITIRLKSGHECHHSVQTLLSSHFLS